MTDKTILKKMKELLDKAIGDIEGKVPVIKQFHEEEKTAIEWLYPVEQEDAHGEYMSREEAEKMVNSLNKALSEGRLKSSIDHVFETEGWHIEKAWVNPVDCYIEETFIPEGWPLVKTKFTNDSLWEARKNGDLGGLSIGAAGVRETVEDE